MSLRDRIARVLCATSPANTEGSAFEDYAECNQREWLETADAILSDPEIAALRGVARCSKTYLRVAERVIHNPEKVRATVYDAARVELDAALARLEEARR